MTLCGSAAFHNGYFPPDDTETVRG